MHEYTVFLSQSGGAFGDMRRVWMLDDQHAIRAATRALGNVEAIDIWKQGQRVALLTRESHRQREQAARPIHA